MASRGIMDSMDSRSLQQAVSRGMSPVEFPVEKMDKRPEFVNEERLRAIYSCGICRQIVNQALQTPCGNRVCETCVVEKFGTHDVIIPCPLTHADIDGDEEYDCKDGLQRGHMFEDVAARKDVSRAKVYCDNRVFGCREIMIWKNLQGHIRESCCCNPVKCSSEGCSDLFATGKEAEHKAVCKQIQIDCEFCGISMTRGSLEEHLEDCNEAARKCETCLITFSNKMEFETHRQIFSTCLEDDCKDCIICGEAFTSKSELRSHLETSQPLHFEIVAAKVLSADGGLKKTQTMTADMGNSREVNRQQEVTACLESSMACLESTNQQDPAVEAKTEEPETINSVRTQVRDIEARSRAQERRVRNLELATYDGVLRWKIADYGRKKSEAAKGRNVSIYSHPFYTSRKGYKMCAKIYLNGDGVGRNQYLSIFFVVMRGEYDDLLQWPFQQKVTFQLIHPRNDTVKEESFKPDPRNSSFKKPESDMNIASGYPKFVKHANVQEDYLFDSGCIYIRVEVDGEAQKL